MKRLNIGKISLVICTVMIFTKMHGIRRESMLEERIKRNAELLTKNLNAIKLLDENELSHLYELHDLYVEGMRLTGELITDDIYFKKKTYTERKHENTRRIHSSK